MLQDGLSSIVSIHKLLDSACALRIQRIEYARAPATPLASVYGGHMSSRVTQSLVDI
jgi:hypothetical protein